MKALEKEGWLKVLVPHFSVAKVDSAGLNQVFKVKQQMQEVGVNPDASPIVMHFLTRKLGDKDISGMQKQIVNKGFVERWKHLEDDAKDFAKKLMAKDLALPSQTWKFLMTNRPDALLVQRHHAAGLGGRAEDQELFDQVAACPAETTFPGNGRDAYYS